MKRLAIALVLCLTALPARAGVAENERELIAACQNSGKDIAFCRCAVGALKSNAAPRDYEVALAFMTLALTNQMHRSMEIIEAYGLEAENFEAMGARITTAMSAARQSCE